ncbi:MAG: site-specific integrase [Actinomycetota bacterium]|nr:site-specific integrase [Actinomycetota bacterium]
MSIHARKTARGVRYDVRLRDPAGRLYKRTFRTKREAETFEARERADRSRGSWVDPRKSETRFGDVARYWLTANPGKRASGLARDESIVRCHLLPALANRPVSAVTPQDVQGLVTKWSRDAAPRTVRRQYGVLRAIFNAAVNLDLVARTPCRGIKLPAVDQPDRHIVTPEELERLGEALGVGNSLMAYMAAVLGLRWGECAGLRVGRIDFLRSTVTVAEQRTRGRAGAMVTGAPKSRAGRRTISVPRVLMVALGEHLRRRGLTGADVDAFVFVGPGGGPLSYSTWLHRVWNPACCAVGLRGLRYHDLRHANATGMVAAGIDVKTAQTRLGHSDPRLTLAVYAQATNAADRAAADQLGALFMAARNESGNDCQVLGPA